MMRSSGNRLWSSGGLIAAILAMGVGCGGDENREAFCDNLESGTTCTWMGTPGSEGFNGDGLHRVDSKVNQPQDMVWLADGSAWFTDFNNFLMRRVLPDGTVQAMVGGLDPIFPGDGPLGGITPGEAVAGSDWFLNHPTNMVVDADGSIILVAWHNHKILRINPDTVEVEVVCGQGAGYAGDGGPASAALFKQVQAAALDDDGNLYLVDQQNQRIRMIDPNDDISLFAGTGAAGDAGDGGSALDAQFSWAVGSNPNPSGGIVHHQGKLYVSDTENHRIRVIDLTTGVVDALAGSGTKGDSGDGGPAVDAQLSAPRDLEIGPDGDLYFADTDNSRVKAVDLDTGIIRNVVGTGELGFEEEEGLPALETSLRRPFGVSFDPEGNLYVLDTLNNRVVKVQR